MAAVSSSPVSRSVDAFRASGEQAISHPERWELEDAVIAGIHCLEQICQSYQAWRDRIYTGQQEFTPEVEADYRKTLTDWLEITNMHVLPAVENFEKVMGFNTVACAQSLRADVVKAEGILQKWTTPSPTTFATFRGVRLTEDESRFFFDAVDEAAERPPTEFRRIGTPG